jgi:hypothetical protein
MLKKILISLAAFTIIWSVGTAPALALQVRTGLEDAAGSNGAGYSSTSLTVIIGKLITVFLSLLGVIFLLLTIYAGFLWMTAAGDDKKIQSAKNILSAAVVGLVIILAAYAISDFVLRSLSAATGNSSEGGSSDLWEE